METLRRDDPRERSSCRRLFDIKPGMTFNFLTTVEYLPGTKDRKQYWLCKCVCGKLVYATPTALRKDRAVSCGCCTRRRKKKVRMTPERRRQLQKLAAIPGPTPLEIEYGY